MKSLGEILEYEQPTKYIVKSENYDNSYLTPVLTPGQTFILGYTNEKDGIYSDPLPVIIFDDFTTATKLVNFPFKVKSSAMKILKPANKNVYILYWYYYLSSLKVDNDLHKRYWISTFANRQVPVPALSEQKRIAGRLDKVQELIALQKEQLKKLDDLIKSRFIDIFGNPITSKRFSRNTLRNCGTWQTGGTPSRQHHEYFGGKLPWITTIALENIYVGKNDAVDYISDIGLQNSTTKLIPEDSLLFAIRVGVGKVSINTCKICTNQDIVSLSLNPSRKYSLIYLYFMFRLCENYFTARTRGATIKGITVDTIKDFPIIDAPYALQTQFADFVTKIEAQKGLLATRLSHLETLYKSLMQEYFG